MIKTVLFVLLVFITGCSISEPQPDYYYPSNDYPAFQYSGGTNFYSVYGLFKLLSSSLSWVSDKDNYGYTEYWATPEETVKRGKGDCEDQTLLFMALANYVYGEKPNLICINYVKTSGHVVCYLKGYLYDVTDGRILNIRDYDISEIRKHYSNYIDAPLKSLDILTFAHAMNIAYTTHNIEMNFFPDRTIKL